MTVVNPPGFLQAGTASHPAKVWRRAFQGLLTEGVTNFNVSGDLLVKQNSPTGMSVLVSRGGCYVQGDDSTDQGLYFMYNDADLAVAISAAHATLPRKDIIVARIKDATEGGTAGDTSTIEVVTGIAAASPTEPAIPASAYRLATIDVAAAATTITNANITDRRSRASGTSTVHTPVMQSFVGARVYRTAVLSVPNATNTVVPFDAESHDTANIHDNVTNNSRLTVPTGMTGYWAYYGMVGFAANATGNRMGFVRLNGATTLLTTVDRGPLATQPNETAFNDIRLLTAGDYLELLLWQDSTAALNTLSGDNALFFGMQFLGV